jgi:HlyD family secretion protein
LARLVAPRERREAKHNMDIPRPELARRKRRRRIVFAAISLSVMALVTIGLSRLKPAAPTVEKATVWMDTVKRGSWPRQVRGNGRLVPEQILLIQAETGGLVERIHVLPGAAVTAQTLLIELSNPELKQSAFEVEWQVKAAEAQLTRLKVQLESDRLNLEAQAATLKSEYTLAEVDARADEELSKSGLVPKLALQKSRARADELKSRHEIERQRLAIFDQSVKSQIAVQEAELAKLVALRDLRRKQVESLMVRAGFEGVLQQIGDRETLRIGQRVGPASTLAKVVIPTQLKAEIKIPETQAKDLLLGQVAEVDTHNGLIPAQVTRIDPAAQGGYVTIDLALKGVLPKGARPDMNVEGTVELERLTNVLYVGKMVNSQTESTVGVFKLQPNSKEAIRVPVKLGRSSVNYIEVLEGLEVGDTVILSDMSQWDAHDRIRLN